MKPVIVFAITIPIVAAVVVAFSVFLVSPMGQQNFEEDTHENQHEDAAWQSLQKMQGESVVSAKCSGTQRCILGVVTDIIDGDTIRVGGESVRFALSSAWNLMKQEERRQGNSLVLSVLRALMLQSIRMTCSLLTGMAECSV